MLHFNHLESGRADHLQQLVKSQVHDGILVPLQRPAVQPQATRLQRRVDGFQSHLGGLRLPSCYRNEASGLLRSSIKRRRSVGGSG